MKQIQELIKATQVLRVEGNSDTRVSRLAYDSRRIAPGDCFFAVSGTQSDGHAYIDAAVTAESVASLTDEPSCSTQTSVFTWQLPSP